MSALAPRKWVAIPPHALCSILATFGKDGIPIEVNRLRGITVLAAAFLPCLDGRLTLALGRIPVALELLALSG
jgi:hypothetical protein